MVTVTMGRNAVCSCGSGRKYKKCCLARVEARTSPRPPGREGENLVYVQTPADMAAAKEQAAVPPRLDVRLTPPGAAREGTPETILATAEHPFYVYGKGWVPLREIRQGDWLRTERGWIEVNAVNDTGRWETVYNVRVADNHTYFVGKDESGSAVWAHNTCYEIKVSPTGLVQIFVTGIKDAVATARSTNSLARAAYYLANQQATEVAFNQVLVDIDSAIKRAGAPLKGLAIPEAASQKEILKPGQPGWDKAVEAIKNPSRRGIDFRVESQAAALQLLQAAYPDPQDMPLQQGDTPYEHGYEVHTTYEGSPYENSLQNNLQHLKWRDTRTGSGHTPSDGHIYYGSWSGPHKYDPPKRGWSN